MDNTKIEAYLLANSKYFDAGQIPYVRQKLQNATEDQYMLLQSVEYKDPIVSLVLSLLVGTLGVDRFYVGDVGMGVLKLLTLGGCGIISIIDWFTIMKKTRAKNFAKFSMVC